MSKHHERRYHATWMRVNGASPLAKLGTWMTTHRARAAAAPRDLLAAAAAAAADVAARLPLIAAREPTRLHRKHFSWLLGWYQLLAGAIGTPVERSVG